MKRIFFTIDGKPIPQARHRTNKGRTYDPSAKAKQEFNLQSRRYAPPEPISGPVLLYLVFYMPVPKGALKQIQGDARMNDIVERPPSEIALLSHPKIKEGGFYKAEILHVKKPDAGNLQKLVEDALNGLMWVDDSQVQIGGCFKIYSHNPRTEVEIYYE